MFYKGYYTNNKYIYIFYIIYSINDFILQFDKFRKHSQLLLDNFILNNRETIL